MSEQMTIVRVMEGDEWGNDYGRNQSYTLDLELTDGSVVQDIVSNRKIKDDGTHNEPNESEVIWGDLEPMSKGRRKLKLDYDAMKNEGSSASGSSRPSESSTSSSGRNIDHSIARQVALKILAPTINQEGLSVGVQREVVEIETFILEAGQKASQGAAQTGDSPHSSSPPAAPDSPPADLSGARTEEPGHTSLNYPRSDLPDVDRDHIMQLLSSAGMIFAGAQEKVADYILTQLSVSGREKAALNGLQDQNLDRQSAVLAQLKTETEKWLGSPLPQGDALDGEEDPPF
jgi:hypothetical protein